MNKKWSKKASLNLSIEAIVIIVIAFTVLGLGLGFVKDQMSKMTEGSGAVQEQIQQQIMEDLRTGDKKINFPTDEVKLNKGDSKQLAVGVKNTDEVPLTFKLKVKLVDTGSDITSKETVKDTDNFDIGEFIWNPTPQTLEPTEANVFPIKFVGGKHADTYTFEIIIEREDGTIYATKSFFITIL